MDDLALVPLDPGTGGALAAFANSTLGAPLIQELADEVDLEQCRLLGPVALVAQGIMGALVIGSLVLKRMREQPRRKWKIWLGDVGKQVVGQAFVHASNLLIADVIASHTSENPCSLYAAQILIDTTLGVLLLYYLLALSTSLMRTHLQPQYQTGFYGHPFSLSLWGEQAAVYVACLGAMKAVVVLLMWAIPLLQDAVSWILSWITSDEAQVVIVMLVLPLVMNLFQFLMVDSFLKSNDSPSALADLDTDEEALRRGFLEGGDDDEEDYDRHAPGDDSGYVDHQRGRAKRTPPPSTQAPEEERALLDADSPILAQRAYPSPHPAAHEEDDSWADNWDGSASETASEGAGARVAFAHKAVPLVPLAPAPAPLRREEEPARVRPSEEEIDDWVFGDEHDEPASAPAPVPVSVFAQRASSPPRPAVHAAPRPPPPPPHAPAPAPDPEQEAEDDDGGWGFSPRPSVDQHAFTSLVPPAPPSPPAPAPAGLDALPALVAAAAQPRSSTPPQPLSLQVGQMGEEAAAVIRPAEPDAARGVDEVELVARPAAVELAEAKEAREQEEEEEEARGKEVEEEEEDAWGLEGEEEVEEAVEEAEYEHEHEHEPEREVVAEQLRAAVEAAAPLSSPAHAREQAADDELWGLDADEPAPAGDAPSDRGALAHDDLPPSLPAAIAFTASVDADGPQDEHERDEEDPAAVVSEQGELDELGAAEEASSAGTPVEDDASPAPAAEDAPTAIGEEPPLAEPLVSIDELPAPEPLVDRAAPVPAAAESAAAVEEEEDSWGFDGGAAADDEPAPVAPALWQAERPPPPAAAAASDAAEDDSQPDGDRDGEDPAAVVSEQEDLDELGVAEEASSAGESCAETPVEDEAPPAPASDEEPAPAELLVSIDETPSPEPLVDLAAPVPAAAESAAAVEEEEDSWGFDGSAEADEPAPVEPDAPASPPASAHDELPSSSPLASQDVAEAEDEEPQRDDEDPTAVVSEQEDLDELGAAEEASSASIASSPDDPLADESAAEAPPAEDEPSAPVAPKTELALGDLASPVPSPPASSKEVDDADADEEDEWGFGSPSIPAPSPLIPSLHSPSTPPAAAATVASSLARASVPPEEEEDDDDSWGFDDSPSLTEVAPPLALAALGKRAGARSGVVEVRASGAEAGSDEKEESLI